MCSFINIYVVLLSSTDTTPVGIDLILFYRKPEFPYDRKPVYSSSRLRLVDVDITFSTSNIIGGVLVV